MKKPYVLYFTHFSFFFLPHKLKRLLEQVIFQIGFPSIMWHLPKKRYPQTNKFRFVILVSKLVTTGAGK